MLTLILTIILFCVMIFPHELGHFIAAKKMDVKVNEFAFGMGPKLWKKQRGETLHSIRLLPIGGFCAMEGEDGESDEPRAFGNKKPWQKIIILAAGSLMNVLCAILIMIIITGVSGFTTNFVGELSDDSAAKKAGLLVNDEIVRIDGKPIETWEDVSTTIMQSTGEPMEIEVKRNGDNIKYTVNPVATKVKLQDGTESERYLIGVTSKISHNPFKAIVVGTKATWEMTGSMFSAIGNLFTGKAGIKELAGPVGMVQMVSQTQSYGWWYYGFLTALICMNLAIVNMLPLPALDGGRIIFVIIGMITGKPVSEKAEGTVHLVGIAVLLLLMAYVTFNDITRIFG